MKIRKKETEARFSPTMSLYEFAETLLGDNAKKYFETHKRIIIENRRIDIDLADYNALIRHISPESIQNGFVRIISTDGYRWTLAKAAIEDKFGIELKYQGNRRAVNGFILRTRIQDGDNGSEQVKKYAEFIRQIKRSRPDIQTLPVNCNDIEEESKPCDIQPFFEDRRKRRKPSEEEQD